MKLVWELSINVLEVVIIYDFLVRYFGYRVSGIKRYVGTIMIGIISFAIISFLSLLIAFEPISTVLVAGMNYIFCVNLLNGRAAEKAFFSVFIMALVAISATVSTLVFETFLVEDVVYTFSLSRMLAMVFAKVLLLFFTRIILRFKSETKITIHNMVLLILIPMFSIIAITLLMFAALEYSKIQGFVLGAIIIIALIDVLVFELLKRVHEDEKEKQEYALMKLQYNCAQNNRFEIQQMYEEMQSVRHDLQNHLSCIDHMVEGQKYDETQKYVKELLQQQQEEWRTIVFTGNNILDAILNIKISMAEKKGIHCTVFITFTDLPLSESDICVLFGNLLDNAIEAASKAPKKDIDVRIARQGWSVYICIQNTIAEPVMEQNSQLRTSKEDKQNHGFGIQNTTKIVEHADGMIEFNEENNKFICDIMIPLSTNYVQKPTNYAQGIEKR